uniref:Uncharacterized protein n=1 Tax=Siphoviridae sp. ctZHD14 TaxID=2827891 RepID=A0A8S5SX10_9CAUD|nr:MAG TPA: hypothetical protein [Siphoviridae sp. ctZHD14]
MSYIFLYRLDYLFTLKLGDFHFEPLGSTASLHSR